ncbi:MAG: trimethylamine methyltransferase family protein, partial [Steroidobacteraceae bacterium]
MRPSLNILGPDLIAKILEEAKRVLGEVGMEIRGSGLRELLLAHGLPLDRTGERVLFPRAVVEQAILDAPRRFWLYDRAGAPHADIGDDRVHFVPGSSGLKVLDHRSGETRLANSTDFAEYVRLGDGLAHIPYLATAFSTNDDIESQVSDAWRLYMTLTNSNKPVVSGAFTEHGVPRMVEMMQLFRRDRSDLVARPMSIFTITATGNFRYSEDSCQNLVDCVEAGIAVEIVPVTLMGLIAPVTIVGATVFHTVDVLAGITMAQLIRPGTPVLFGGAPATFHMKIASSPMSAIEALQLDAAYVAVAKSLGLPTQSYMALSDSPLLDAQAGAETFGSALIAALAGVNSVSGPGMLDYLLVFSLPKLVFDDEMCGQALRFVREVKVVDDLPVDRLVEQLLADQHLILAEHTTAHWPTELYLPGSVVDRDNREAWMRQGSKDTYQRACDEVNRRLAAYHPLVTDPAVDAELRAIIKSG